MSINILINMGIKLKDIHPEINMFVNDLNFFGKQLSMKGYLPANSGNASILLSSDASEQVLRKVKYQTDKISFDSLPNLKKLRRDGRTHYNVESLEKDLLKKYVEKLDERLIIITATGAKLWDIERNPDKRICIFKMSPKLDGFHIMFGNKE